MGRTACIEPQCLYKGSLFLFVMEIVLYKNIKSVCNYMYFEIFCGCHINKYGLHMNANGRIVQEGVCTTYKGFIMCLLYCSKMRDKKYMLYLFIYLLTAYLVFLSLGLPQEHTHIRAVLGFIIVIGVVVRQPFSLSHCLIPSHFQAGLRFPDATVSSYHKCPIALARHFYFIYKESSRCVKVIYLF